MAGSYVNQNEFGNIDLLRDGQEYWLTLDDFIKMAGIRFEKKGDFLEFVTPIGAARLPKESMGEFDGRSYISAELLLEKFNIQATFSQMDYAIILDIPWRPGAPLADEVGDEAELDVVKPDIRSTAGALGFFRAQGDMKQDSNVDTDAWNGTADMGGRLVGGTWFLGARGARGLDPWLDRYFWNREFEKSVVRLGFHNIQLHSFFTSHQFNGAQWAYNNMGIAPYTDFSGSNTLESMLQEDSGENINIIRHDGHPGGIAELRINDRTVAYARVGLDGRYEFLDIRKSGWGLLSVKVLLYKRSISEVPTAVVDLTRMQAAQSLKMGELMIRAGLGRIRNPQVVVPSQVKEYGVGFLHGRYGFTENVTLLGAAQNRSEDEIESLAGLRISLGKHWAWSVDAASHDGTMAYSSELRGMDKNWEFWLRNLRMENGYGVNIVTIDNGYIETEEHDHYMQSLYQVFDSFKIGLFGRDAKRRLVEDIKYVLPGFYFTPGYSLSLSAVPNLDGEYRVSGLYSLASDKRLSLIFENHQYNVSLYYDMSPRHNFTAVYEYNDITRDTIGLVNFYWFFHQTNQSHLNLGVSHNTGYPGLVAGLQWMITPGMELGLEYTNGHHRTAKDSRNQTFSARFQLGMANTENGFTPVQNSLLSFVRGGISGAVYNSTGVRLDVDDLQVLINGSRISQIMAGGRFFVGNLKPGIYLVEIDEGTLPIEFKIARKFFRVEVAAGAITQVDFTAMAYYGVAGKVEWPDGAPVNRAAVRAYDPDGNSVGVGLTDQFGYYRIDNLAPGEYSLIVEATAGKPLGEPRPAIHVVIADDYIFDQNIDLFEPPAPIPPPTQ